MKNINKQLNQDPIAEARKGQYFQDFSQEAKERISLGVEIYKQRKVLQISQKELAKRAKTTQKVVSRIENGDVNLGFALLSKIARVLDFDYKNWSRVLGFSLPCKLQSFASDKISHNNQVKASSSS
ncbi:MAG: helix-turn-helix domain-containing protein [Candidatus Pacebacteria bacterium]|nr:helix-turn-helix domain-containing protein [Candidatus Paceibacterota bacterium]